MKRSMPLTAAACFCLDRQIPIFGEKPQTFRSPTRWFDSCFKCLWFSVRAGDTHLRRVTEMFFSAWWQVSRACCGSGGPRTSSCSSVAEAESRRRPARGRWPCQVGAVSLQNLPYRHQLYSAFWIDVDIHPIWAWYYFMVSLPGWKKKSWGIL